MTNLELERFKSTDQRKYILAENEEFLRFLLDSNNRGIEIIDSLQDFQSSVNFIANWYEKKYPNEIIAQSFFKNDVMEEYKKISNNFSFDDMKNSCPLSTLKLLECNYRNSTYYIANYKGLLREFIYVDLNDELIGPVLIDKRTGDVFNKSVTPLIYDNGEQLDINELYDFYAENLTEMEEKDKLEKIILNKSFDKRLRKKILDIVVLKLLYSNNSTPSVAYKRALLYIEEINKEIPDLYFDYSVIDQELKNDKKVNIKKKLRRCNKLNYLLNK